MSPILLVSLGAHLVVGAALALIPKQTLQEVVAIALNEAPPPKDEPKPPLPPKPAPPPVIAVAKPKVLVAKRNEPQCTESIVKARPLSLERPGYTEEARRARVQGR